VGRLRIAASGKSPQAQNQARGRLFEQLMADVLRHFGYAVDSIPNVNYAGMEIDIEGRSLATGLPLYAECKAYESEIDSPKFQGFFGKYMARWLQDKRSAGLFIAIPGLNSHAKGFYRENCENNSELSIRLLEDADVLETIFLSGVAVRPETAARAVPEHLGSCGDWILLYSDRGCFWIQFVVPPGSGIAKSLALLDARGESLTDKVTVDYLLELVPELHDFDILELDARHTTRMPVAIEDVEEVVEVRGSSACFEYQFPASPEFLVGRTAVLAEVDQMTEDMLKRRTSSRGILFEANSGWGKSSVVLASVHRLAQAGHYPVAIDSRSASSSQFILRVVEYVIGKFGDFDGALDSSFPSRRVGGFDAAGDAIIDIGRALESRGKILFIFLDQFENLFFLPDSLRHVRDLLLKICDAQTNVVLGFSWKTDLVGLTNEFPYQMRDAITGSSKRITLDTFSEIETNALLDRLRSELRSRLRKDLTFFLSEFSQGYPWLLKKLCAHVKSLRFAGVSQTDIANSLLNVEELFEQDLQGLSAEEEETLRRIANAAPIGIFELGEDFNADTVQSLVNRRLIVRIGTKYDIYWDIFRDYLNSGRVPAQENYILRMQVGSVSKAVKILVEENRPMSVDDFKVRAGLAENSFLNVAKDMRLLGLVRVEAGQIKLQVGTQGAANNFEEWFRASLRERLRRNRLVSRIAEELDTRSSLTLDEVALLLATSNPYISATQKTWRYYARSFADWMDAADIAIFDSRKGRISRYQPRTEVRERRILPSRSRGGISVPRIQYSPVERAAIRLVEALTRENRIDWSGFERSTVFKSLLTLEDLGFISRKTQAIEVLPRGIEFATDPARRRELFAEGALRMKAFSAFVEVLEQHRDMWLSLPELGEVIREKLGTDWKVSTATTNAKIMLDWARHAGLAPGVYATRNLKESPSPYRRRRRTPKAQTQLFPNEDLVAGFPSR
jgi:hypothetical protein